MQAIWRQEPPDQRYFRLYDLDVSVVSAVTAGQTAALGGNPGTTDGVVDALPAALGDRTYAVTFPPPTLEVARWSTLEANGRAGAYA